MFARGYFIAIVLISVAVITKADVGAATCASDELPCDDGQCILRVSWCDGNTDCNDGSDEDYCDEKSFLFADPNQCKKSDDHFFCANGRCIPKVAFCDGLDDCTDNSDEEKCETLGKDEDKDDESDGKRDEDSAEHMPTMELAPFDVEDDDSGVMPANVPALHSGHQNAVERAVEWLMSVRHSNYGWGEDTARALIALGLTKPLYFQRQAEDVDLMKKQLQVVIAVDMLKNRTQPVSLSRLSLYINALLATCQNPFSFHGMDLVKELRQRVSAVYSIRQRTELFVSPVAHLTLCVANQSTINDVHKLMTIIRLQSEELKWQDMRALAIMALSCIVENYEFARGYGQALHQAVERLRHILPHDRNFGNIYSTALVVQALLSVHNGRWGSLPSIDLTKFQNTDGSFGDLLATYYILPALSGQSLVRLKNMPCFRARDGGDGHSSLDVLLAAQSPRHYVRYSLLYGYPVEVSYSILLHIPVGTKFFDIMRLAEYTDPKFKFQYQLSNNNISVFSIGDTPNDAERGVYWQLFARLNGRYSDLNDFKREIGSNLHPYVKGVASLVPKDRDHVAFWYRP